ncbi:hypothetical protein E4U13_005167 [Claviceps humidiphila]|uniref:Protein kinase domain-containing protein n=1 Tax=Claviceps humidiphila TaxID=1294629 RepID=A0A9P7PYS8_9HYPO|nr:hypothetical protein E4U13_005167 [Claviceps humidiphila]
MDQQNDTDDMRQKIQELERQIQEIKLQIQPRKRQTKKMKLRDKAIKRRIYNGLHRVRHKRERERQADKKDEKALQQTQQKDSATQEDQEQTKILKQETEEMLMDRMLQPTNFCEFLIACQTSSMQARNSNVTQKDSSTAQDSMMQHYQNETQEIKNQTQELKTQAEEIKNQTLEIKRRLLQPTTLDEYIKEWHASTFSKLTIHSYDPQRDPSTANILGKWQPETLKEWTIFLSEQRLILNQVYDVLSPEVRKFFCRVTIRDIGDSVRPITDKWDLEGFSRRHIETSIRNIMRHLQSVDTLGKLFRIDGQIDFMVHPRHANPLGIMIPSSEPNVPIITRFCLCEDPSVSLDLNTLLYVWEPKGPEDLTVEDLRAALRPTSKFGAAIFATESPVIDDVSPSTTAAEKRVQHAIIETYNKMMDSCLEYGIITTGQAMVFLHFNWDDPKTLHYHIAEPLVDVVRGPEEDAALLTALGQYIAFTIMAINKRSDKPTQEQRLKIHKTLPKVGVPSVPVSLPDNGDNASSCSLSQTGESETEKIKKLGQQYEQGTKTTRSIEGAQDLPYCTQKCLLGLVRGEFLDPACPNVALHCQSKANEAGHQECHPVDHAEWLRLLREQFKHSIDEGITYQKVFGEMGALFKVTLLAYGYTFISKGTRIEHAESLQYETEVYQRLKPIQGVHVPVFLGAIDLQTMDKNYWIYFGTYVVHMIFLSWGGHLLKRDLINTIEIPWMERAEQALQALHHEGVLQRDVQWSNILYNAEINGVMLIDFDEADMIHKTATPQVQDTPGEEEEEEEGKRGETREKLCFSFSEKEEDLAACELSEIRDAMLEVLEE